MGIRTRRDVEEPQLEDHRNLMRRFLLRSVALSLLFLSSACALFAPSDRFGAQLISYNELSGWNEDNHTEALRAFLVSCPILSAKARPLSTGSNLQISETLWQSLCSEGNTAALSGNPENARLFFERRFVPYRVNNNGKEEGLFTGYYEPMLYGATRKHGDFIYPVYMKPPDLAKPYLSRADIDSGALDSRRLEILWVDDPVMLFFLHIQGSGRVKLMNGKELYIGYADANGHSYVALGKLMAEENILPKDQINFFTIRQWLYTHKEEAFAMMQRNPSYVFFKLRDKPGAIGAAGAVLTPQRSFAVDSRYIPYGLPVFMETELPPEPDRLPTPFHRTVIAQDTGGAIKGPVRGDIFFGAGDEAEYFAGYMKGRGVYSLLVPREMVQQLQ
jgi:membrane-bound lytic murein transglycosylase A